LSRYSNKIESFGLRKCRYYCYLIEKGRLLADVRITNISQSLPHKMVKNSWHEEITSLSPYVYGPADVTATPSSVAPVKYRMVYLYGTGLPRLSWKKPLDGCNSSSSHRCLWSGSLDAWPSTPCYSTHHTDVLCNTVCYYVSVLV